MLKLQTVPTQHMVALCHQNYYLRVYYGFSIMPPKYIDLFHFVKFDSFNNKKLFQSQT